MEQIILIVHVLAAIGIIGLILVQQGKGADMGASFGAGASQTLFGSSGSGNVLTKSTAILATLFFATSFGLAVVAKNKSLAAGDVGIPVPAVVEQPLDAGDLPEQPANGSDIPQSDEQAIDAAIQAGGLDIPVDEVVPASDEPAEDIPQ